MTYLIVLGIYTLALFIVGFTSRRSMGYPALTLAAGVVLARLWTDTVTPLVADSGVEIISPPLSSLVAITLTIVPALIVMIRSPKVTTHHHSIWGSLVFAVLGVMFTYGAFSNAVVLDDASRSYVAVITDYEAIIITTGLLLAILEVLLYKKPGLESSRKHKK